MNDSLGAEICERIRVEIATGRAVEYFGDNGRIMYPSFGLANGTGSSLKDAKRKLWTPYGCLWVGEEVGL